MRFAARVPATLADWADGLTLADWIAIDPSDPAARQEEGC
jgi:hypothetical protein